MNMTDDNLIHLPRAKVAASHEPVAADVRTQIQAVLNDAVPDSVVPPPLHLEGRWRRASLLCIFGGSYGLIVSQGWSGEAKLLPSALNCSLMILALVFMRIADRQKARAKSR